MKKREELQVNVAGIRRNIKNLAHNYSDAQIKVREATSNDHWGPSSTLMSEIADLTYNVVAFTEIMQMIWKRLNDHGRNWRHVYKALLLLEYLIKTGSEKVAQQCKENIYAIRTLRDFQYFEDGKDPGLNVREKAKQLVALLKDDERLRNERARAIKAKERFMQTASAFGSDTTSELELPPSPPKPVVKDSWRSCSPSTEVAPKAELECARPQTAGEEELQLQLALAMSREEAEQEEQKRRSDDVRLQLALSQSEKEFKQNHQQPTSSHIDDLLEISSSMGFGSQPPLVDPWGMPIAATGSAFRSRDDPWRTSPVSPPPGRPVTPEIAKTSDPWAPTIGCSTQPSSSTMNSDPWASRPNSVTPPPSIPARPTDSWTGSTGNSNINDDDEFAAITKRSNGASVTSDPFDLRSLENGLSSSEDSNKADSQSVKKTAHSFLGENSALVNLDNLITVPAVPPLPTVPQKTATPNPFGHTSSAFNNRQAVNGTSSSGYQRDPFQPVHQQTGSILSGGNLPQPLLPQPNPFLS